MDANHLLTIDCRNGVFTLPDSIYETLAALVTRGVVYVRHDPDSLTISPTKIAEGHRRALNARFREPGFRDVTQLAVMNLQESIQLMPVAWR